MSVIRASTGQLEQGVESVGVAVLSGSAPAGIVEDLVDDGIQKGGQRRPVVEAGRAP